MIQNAGTSVFTIINITNSTFYNNKAYGLTGGDVSGGAIQFFKNGGFSKVKNNIKSCTFVNNQGGCSQSKVNQKGGAIGLSGSSARSSVNMYSNLFIGNKVYDNNGQENTASKFKDISNYSSLANNQQAVDNVLNADSGDNPAITAESVLGKNNVGLNYNNSTVLAGAEGETVKTIAIKPEGLADNTYNGTESLSSTDQRDYARYKDKGAIEMSWLKYDANGGTFTLPDLTTYDGSEYYENDGTNSLYNAYYKIGNLGGQISLLGINDLQGTNGELVFLGWSTDKTTTTPDSLYNTGNSYDYLDVNQTLYAVWGAKQVQKFNLTYDGNGNTAGNVPTDANSPYDEDSQVTVLNNTDLAKTDYNFGGWNTKANGSGTAYQGGDQFVITGDTVLYAQWHKKPVNPIDPDPKPNPDIEIPDPEIPGNPIDPLDPLNPKDPDIEIPDGETPGNPVVPGENNNNTDTDANNKNTDANADEIVINSDAKVAGAGITLPKAGGIAAGLLGTLGVAMAALGVKTKRKNK